MFFVSRGTWRRWLVTRVTHLEVFLHNMSRWTLPHLLASALMSSVATYSLCFFSPRLHRHHCGEFAVTSPRPRLPAEWEHLPWTFADRQDSRHQPAGWVVTATLWAEHLLFFYRKPCRNHSSAGQTPRSGFFSVHVCAVCTVCISVYCQHLPSASVLLYIINSNHDPRSVCQPTFNHDVTLAHNLIAAFVHDFFFIFSLGLIFSHCFYFFITCTFIRLSAHTVLYYILFILVFLCTI